MESNCCHLVYLRRRLLLLVGSRWNMFHVETDFFMPRNILAVPSDANAMCESRVVSEFSVFDSSIWPEVGQTGRFSIYGSRA